MIERQTIVAWYTPDEKKPPEGDVVVATVSGRISRNVEYDHAFALAEWYENDGWVLSDFEPDDFTIHAWCDLMPYGWEKK